MTTVRRQRAAALALVDDSTMKTIFCVFAAVLICAACAQGGASVAGERGGSIEMYGVIDQGVTVRR
jgi:hypothetical protein